MKRFLVSSTTVWVAGGALWLALAASADCTVRRHRSGEQRQSLFHEGRNDEESAPPRSARRPTASRSICTPVSTLRGWS